MVKHVIIWSLKDEYSAEQKETIKAEMKTALEGLAGKIEGLVEIKLHTTALPSSANADVLLDSTFESEDALKNYAVNPIHVEVADTKVRPFVSSRSCMDYII